VPTPTKKGLCGGVRPTMNNQSNGTEDTQGASRELSKNRDVVIRFNLDRKPKELNHTIRTMRSGYSPFFRG